ncbi:neurofilament light polypeptide isoform X2 [Betta splendens]|uniref:Neurofilament light polypeptide isoform X2 n=1 Tax=Betta splendens TaxID=158456 RepID=A0A9W2Y3G8_BETSP|nr:neurofilament light polypeptide isoform X2 [Betta splendens]
MAMLRVSSYRKLFEQDAWRRNAGLRMPRGAALDKCDRDTFDFVAAKSLGEDGLKLLAQERRTIAALNDRLVKLIELARRLEEENGSLECQIAELEAQPSSAPASVSISTAVAQADRSLDAVVERLRRERDEIVCESRALQDELEGLMREHEEAARRRSSVQQERQHVAAAAERLLEPADGSTPAVAAIKFGSPAVTAALGVKEYYCRLAESLQCVVAAAAVVCGGDAEQRDVRGAGRSVVRDWPATKDAGDMKTLVSELQKEFAELEQRNEELEDEAEMKRAAHMEEVAELEYTINELQHRDSSFRTQMKEQCDDYRVLLSEKMARDMEIAAYRSLLEEEEARLCDL